MNTLVQIAHDLKSNTLEATWFGADGNRGCQNFSPLQIEDFKLAAGEHAQKYIDLAGWTPEYIARFKAAEEAEAAEAKAKQEAADKAAFDAEVSRQAEITKAVQAELTKE